MTVPHYDELSVKALWPHVKKDADFTKYFPDTYPAGKGPPRQYFFDVLNTLQPEYLQQVMKHANEQRMSANTADQKEESIAISKFWEEELKAMPYLSRKYNELFMIDSMLFYIQRKAARPSTSSSRTRS